MIDFNSLVKITTFGQGAVLFNIIVGVHGDEHAPVKAVDMLKEYLKNKPIAKSFRIIIANTKALKSNKRFIETDLNRCFPGKRDGMYEEELANYLLVLLGQVEYNFDFHTTSFPVKPYGLFSTYSLEIKRLLPRLGLSNYIFSDNDCLIKFAKNGIGFEMGCESQNKTNIETYKLMRRILERFGVIPNSVNKMNISKVNLLLIYGALYKKTFLFLNKNIKDFDLIKCGTYVGTSKLRHKIFAKNNFYPIWAHNSRLINLARKIVIKD